MRYVLVALVFGLLQGAQAAPVCSSAPLQGRELYLRGSFNGWSAAEAQKFNWTCDHFELLTDIKGEHSFKVGDEDWSADADFGRGADDMHLALKGPEVKRRFEGVSRIRFVLSGSGGPSVLSIDTVGGSLPAIAPPKPVADRVAASLQFDSRKLEDKRPFGAVAAGSTLFFSLGALPGVTKLSLVVEKRRLDGNQEVLEYAELARVPMVRTPHGKKDRWSAQFTFQDVNVYGYWFEAEIRGKTYAYQNNSDPIFWTREKGSGGLGRVAEKPSRTKSIRRFRQTVFDAKYKVPDWAADVVYYYIFPDRFRNGDRSNDPKPGVDRYHDSTVELHKNWLDKPWKPDAADGSDATYNNDFFGGDLAGIIEKLDYIRDLGANTIYMTPIFKASSNHKYDTADYKQIDPSFGTAADFERLTSEAAKRGIRVIPDTSLNHTGSDSVYFNRFGNFKSQGAFEGAKVQPSSPYADWYTFDTTETEPDKQYKGWVGVTDLPEINKTSRAFRNFAYGDADSVMKLWLDRGAAGWRMDVAPWVPDDFWREWRSAVKQHRPDALTVAETWFDASKYFLGDMFDSTMNYIFRNTVLEYAAGGKAKDLYSNIEQMREAYPAQSFYALMNLLSSHDQARGLHQFGWHADTTDASAIALAKQRLKLAVFFQMTFPGAPTVYYGDEVALTGGDDPYNRATYPWADQGGKPDLDMLAEFKRLIKMRHDNAVLRRGTIAAPLHLDDHTIVLQRELGTTVAITATNNAAAAQSIEVKLPPHLVHYRFMDALTGQTVAVKQGRLPLKMAPVYGVVLIGTPL
jgi:glycosidase